MECKLCVDDLSIQQHGLVGQVAADMGGAVDFYIEQMEVVCTPLSFVGVRRDGLAANSAMDRPPQRGRLFGGGAPPGASSPSSSA